MGYIIAIILGCVILAFFFKPIVGLIGYKRDPNRFFWSECSGAPFQGA